jgi:BNR repeat-like domain
MIKKFILPVCLLFILFSGLLFAAESPVNSTVFSHDQENGYGFRIPSLVTAADGTLLAFAERRVGLHDHARNDIVLRRSFDDGKSWQPLQVLADEGRDSLNDPCAVVLESGRILLMYQRFPWMVHARTSGRTQRADPGYDGPRNTRTYQIQSENNGISWSKPRDITQMVRPSGRISIGSPGTGIQLTRGKFRGRIILPLYETRPLAGDERDWLNSVAYSDDQGETWKISNNIPHQGHTGFGNEAQVVELNDGRILLSSRNQGGFYRKYSISEDGGIRWSNFRLDFGLPGTACQGSILRNNPPENGDSLVVFTAPSNKYARNQGRVWISSSNGDQWEDSRIVTPGFFAYSCLSNLPGGNIGLLYEAEEYRKILFTSFSVDWVKEGDPGGKAEPYFSIPLVDLDGDSFRQVVVDREKGQYLGHPTTVMLEDNRTILAVYPKGHGKGGVVYKRSPDQGKTWGDRIKVPDTWTTSKEVPTLHRVEDKYGKKRIIMFSGLYPVRMAVSEDDGMSWSELEQVGDWGGVVVMSSVFPLKTGKGHYMALFHDDGRFFTFDGGEIYKKDRENFNSRMFTLYKTVSRDGGLTWSYPDAVFRSREKHICEPGVIRSPDGNRIAVLLRENSRRDNSQIIFSGNEGRTWTNPRPLPHALTGDRHVLRYAPDGRIVAFFRDRSPVSAQGELLKIAEEEGETNYSLLSAKTGLGSPTEGDWAGWVGTWADLENGTEGQYRIRFKDNTKGWDTTYPAVELAPDGTFITTTYGHWEKGEMPYILSIRFRLEELDARIKGQAK